MNLVRSGCQHGETVEHGGGRSNIALFVCAVCFNRLTPNDPYIGPTAPLTSERCIL